jgi:hypothetical protein
MSKGVLMLRHYERTREDARKFSCEEIIDMVESVINGEETIKSLSKKYGVAMNAIRKILYRKTYYDCIFERFGAVKNWEKFISDILYQNRRKSKGRGRK